MTRHAFLKLGMTIEGVQPIPVPILPSLEKRFPKIFSGRRRDG
jgi:hypothetical protein